MDDGSPTEVIVEPSAFARDVAHVSHVRDRLQVYQNSVCDREKFWAHIARNNFFWAKQWERVSDTNFDIRKGPISIKWFIGATTNLCFNAVDRHVKAGNGDRIAFHWEGHDLDDPHHSITYSSLLERVCKMANVLTSVGVKKGDVVTLYLPMSPIAPTAMLAIARLGAVCNVVFAGFSAEALAGRIADSRSDVVITVNAFKRGPKTVAAKRTVDEAVAICETEHGFAPSVVLVQERLKGEDYPMSSRDKALDPMLDAANGLAPVEWVDSEHPLFILYTSGSTGKPKGLLHTTGGYMVYAATTHRYVFDIHSESDVYWCTADIGWITGHSYVSFGPTVNGCTSVLFEGVPTFPDASRFWQVIRKYRVTQFYTAPTAVRALMKYGEGIVKDALGPDRTLRVLGSVGEPINEAAWEWYHRVVGGGKATIVDTWWQTETGGIMITGLPGADAMRPSYAGRPFFGIQPSIQPAEGTGAAPDAADVSHASGIFESLGGDEPQDIMSPVLVPKSPMELQSVCPCKEGLLCISASWPGQARTIFGDHERFTNVYYSTCPGYYFTGDGAFTSPSPDGAVGACPVPAQLMPPLVTGPDVFYRLVGRVDDVMNVSGHRMSTAEVEAAITRHEAVVECAVVPYPHDIKGEGIYAYVCLREAPLTAETRAAICTLVRSVIGPIATPDKVHDATCGLPKTRSGKIMRRILRKIAAGETSGDAFGDVSTLVRTTNSSSALLHPSLTPHAEPAVVEALIASRPA